MAARVVVDPITRIEGHLRIEAQMDGDTIAQAYSSGTMVRGIEIILRGRDPRDAWGFAQRICGVCTLVHGIASVRAVEDALQIEVPRERATDPQPDDRHAVRPRPRHAFLSPACARLGRHRLRALGGSCRDVDARAEHFAVSRVRRRAISRTCRRRSRPSSSRASSASSPTATGATPRTSCRRKPTSWPWRTTSTRWPGSVMSCGCTRYSAAAIRIRNFLVGGVSSPIDLNSDSALN